jgi:hypothetical protein
MHARAGYQEPFWRQLFGKGPPMIGGQRLAQRRKAALVGIKGLAVSQRFDSRLTDERGRRQVAVTNGSMFIQ